MKHGRNSVAVATFLAIAGGLAAATALADEDDFKTRAPANATYAAACGMCHLAYPPGLLPAASWRAVLDGRADHFGVPLAPAPEVLAEIEAYLLANAGRAREGAAQSLRITEQAWFRHEHGERLQARAAGDPAIGRMSNCAACHRGAEQGRFDDD